MNNEQFAREAFISVETAALSTAVARRGVACNARCQGVTCNPRGKGVACNPCGKGVACNAPTGNDTAGVNYSTGINARQAKPLNNEQLQMLHPFSHSFGEPVPICREGRGEVLSPFGGRGLCRGYFPVRVWKIQIRVWKFPVRIWKIPARVRKFTVNTPYH
jgi:hypothetical protein